MRAMARDATMPKHVDIGWLPKLRYTRCKHANVSCPWCCRGVIKHVHEQILKTTKRLGRKEQLSKTHVQKTLYTY